MNWNLPNLLTVGRVVLAGVFFLLLGLYEPPADAAQWAGHSGRWLLNTAFVVFIIAGLTDILDGYIARKWNLCTAFGRITDPFVDKVLIVGAFAMLAGRNFMLPPQACFIKTGTPLDYELSRWMTGDMHSAVQAWMVVVVLAREFIVSAVRGYSESQGVKFPATPAGKIKMFIQSLAVGIVLYQMANLPLASWAVTAKVAAVFLAVIVTVLSMLGYIERTVRLMRSTPTDSP